MFTCWDGTAYVVFSSRASALAHAEECRAAWRELGHPMADCPPSALVEEGALRYWVRPGMGRADGALTGAVEAPPCEAGDDSAAQSVASFFTVSDSKSWQFI